MMEKTLELVLNNETLHVPVMRKKQNKRMYLRLKNGQPVITCPARCSDRAILEFVRSQAAWIARQRAKEALAEQRHRGENGERMYWLGRPYDVSVEQASRSRMVFDGEKITFYLKEDTEAERKAAFRSAAEKQMQMFIDHYRGEWDEKICDASRIPHPVIRMRDMSSRWGSCAKHKNEIHMSVQLMHYPPVCTNAVLLHEYAHLLVSNHSAAFYAVVLRHMPEYREIHRLLKQKL